jgi:tripartite-type tricarboxylate transporter receptor subunit TctC
MQRALMSDLRRSVPHGSLPPCGGGTGRGVATHSERAIVTLQKDVTPLCLERTSLAADAALAVTPLPVPPPQGGREPCGARLRNARIALAALFALATLGTTSVSAEPIEDFYKGKTINWILSAGAGGGYSSYAHVFAPYLSAHIPGKPNIVVQNMPGAGGIRAMIFLNNVAPKDGTTIGMVHSSVPYAPLYGIRGANFDPRRMSWVGSINAATGICVSWTASGITTWRDLFEKEFVVGGTGAGSQMETMPAMINKLFGTRIKVVSGYKGGNDVYLAMERGEVHGRCGGLKSSIKSTRPDWFPQKKVAVPVQIALERDPEFADSPALIEFTKDEKTRLILQLVLSPMDMDRPILLPPGTPPDKVAALRKAFSAAMKDPGLIAEAKKANIELEEIAGEKIQTILDRAYAMPANVIKEAKDAMSLTGAANE